MKDAFDLIPAVMLGVMMLGLVGGVVVGIDTLVVRTLSSRACSIACDGMVRECEPTFPWGLPAHMRCETSEGVRIEVVK